MAEDGAITNLLQAVADGDPQALERLVSLVQARLQEMAAYRMRQERDGHTLQPTALVNEAYLRLVSGESKWENRAHFFGAAAEAMRRVLVDHARKYNAGKRGGGAQHVTFSQLNVAAVEPDLDVLELDEAIGALDRHDGRLAEVVRLRFFVGLSIEETAEALGVSPATVKRDWTYARAWLLERMADD
jgi:RNA polymerase sigma factor (TIGR02999 family)